MSEKEELLEKAFQYFRHTDSIYILKQGLKCINPNVNVKYDDECEPCIVIDDEFVVYKPDDNNKEWLLNKIKYYPGDRYEPPSQDEVELCSNNQESFFYMLVVKYYANHLRDQAEMAMDCAEDYLESIAQRQAEEFHAY